MKTYCPTTPPAKAAEIVPLQKALKAAGFYHGPLDGIFGAGTGDACRAAKWAFGFPGKNVTHCGGQNLLNLLNGTKGLPPAYIVRRHARGFGETQQQRQRDAIVKFARWGATNTAAIHYAQVRPMDHLNQIEALPWTTDCSEFVTTIYKWAGAPDPNGLGYNGLGYCHEPSARILTSDLRWVEAGSLGVGDELWALDESNGPGRGRAPSRRYRRASVVASFPSMKECVRVCLESGETFICSSDHPWLSWTGGNAKHRWTPAEQLLERSDERYLVRPFMPWTTETSYEAGWLAGMFDGEGWVVNRAARGGRTNGIGVTQTVGATADRLTTLCKTYGDFVVAPIQREGVKPRIDITSNGGGVTQAAAFLGKIRPERLIANFNLEGGVVQDRHKERVVAVERVGEHEVQSIQTTTGTYFAEGFAVHNTGTMLDHGVSIPLYQCVAGDVVIWGGFPGHHTAVLVEDGKSGDPLIVSHGSERGPLLCRLSAETAAQGGRWTTFKRYID